MRPITRMVLFPLQMSLLPFLLGIGAAVGAALPAIGAGFSILGGISGKTEQRKTQGLTLEARQRQLISDAATARLNAEQLGIKREAFGRKSEEQIGDIGETGESVSAERAALAAAEGFGGGGTARSVQAGISRRVSRDIMRVRESLQEQTDIFNLQIAQQEQQATAFETEATFAGQQAVEVTKKSLFKPSTWFL